MPNGVMLEGGSQTGRQKQKAWRTAVADTAHQHRPETPLDGPLMLRIQLRMPRPKARRRAHYADRKPDIDKLVRCTSDALTDSGVILDDSRICELSVVKMYADANDPWTGADITITQLGEVP
jgi:Holliday junction resolvase RusA-like endonuclease